MHPQHVLRFALTLLFGASFSTALVVPKPGRIPSGAPAVVKARTDSTHSTQPPTASTTSKNYYPREVPFQAMDGTTHFGRRRITAREDDSGNQVPAIRNSIDKSAVTRSQIYDYFHPEKHKSSARDDRSSVTDLYDKQPSSLSDTRSPKGRGVRTTLYDTDDGGYVEDRRLIKREMDATKETALVVGCSFVGMIVFATCVVFRRHIRDLTILKWGSEKQKKKVRERGPPGVAPGEHAWVNLGPVNFGRR